MRSLQYHLQVLHSSAIFFDLKENATKNTIPPDYEELLEFSTWFGQSYFHSEVLRYARQIETIYRCDLEGGRPNFAIDPWCSTEPSWTHKSRHLYPWNWLRSKRTSTDWHGWYLHPGSKPRDECDLEWKAINIDMSSCQTTQHRSEREKGYTVNLERTEGNTLRPNTGRRLDKMLDHHYKQTSKPWSRSNHERKRLKMFF